MIAKLLPYPLLTLALTLFWMTVNRFSPGHLLLGAAVALIASWAMAALRPAKPEIHNWPRLVLLMLIVFYDILCANITVAGIILFRREHRRMARFVTVPLELRDPMGLAMLAIILTSTPGSAWLEYNATQSTLLLHVLDVADENAWVDLVKTRYEKPLMEIFE